MKLFIAQTIDGYIADPNDALNHPLRYVC